MQKLTRSLFATGALALTSVLAACGDDVTIPPDAVTVTVTPQSVPLKVAETATLTASVQGGASNIARTVTWTSSNSAVATVDATGKVTAVTVGNATITAASTAEPTATGSALVTVTGRGVQSVVVQPPTAILKPGEFVQAQAVVTRDPGVAGTVTWTSSATAIATVDNTGKVTAVSQGSALITAASTVDATVSGQMALTVRPLQQAQVSIQAVTQGGTNQPVNFNNVSGQIDVVLNVDPGDETVTSVAVNIDGQQACTRNLSVGESEELRMAAAFPELEAVDVVCSINTAEFNTTTGAVRFLNGAHTISASAVVAGPPQRTVTSSNQPATFNNQSGFIALVSNTNTVGGPASAVNPTTGRRWVQGNVQLKLAAVNYTAGGATVSSINAAFLGKTFTDTPDAGTQIFTIDFPNSGTGALNIVNYETTNLAETMPVVNSSNLSTGTQGPTQIVNIGPKADTLGLTRLDSTRVDNVAPVAPTVGAFPLWLNAAFTFTAANAAITGINDTGVDAVTTEFWVIKGTNPTAACDLTGMTKVTASAGLEQTIVSTDFQGKVVLIDALGNRRCAPLGNSFGVDFLPPNNVTLAGIANNAFFGTAAAGTNAAGTSFVLASTGDNASGISATTPGLVSIVRVNATGPNTCVLGSGTACAQVASAGTASITATQTGEGYYTLTAQMTDVAGNAAPVPPFTRLFLVDATAPSFTGNVGLAAQYQGNAAATFSNLQITDNLDLSRLFGVVNYATAAVNIEYPSQSIGSFGTPLEKTFSGNYTIASLIRCINPAGSFAANAAAEATQITFTAEDQAGNQGTVAPVAGALQAALDNCGAVGNLTAPAAILGFNQSAPAFATGKTQLDIDGASLATASASSVTLSAIADVSLDNSPEPFTRVEFYYVNAAGNLVRAGQAGAGVLNQTTTTRTWTYTFNWDPDAAVQVGTVTIYAIGIDAQGDAVLTGTQTVTTVQ